VGLAYRTRIELKLAHGYAQRTKAYYLALGGVERLKALLSEQELSASVIARIGRFTATAKQEGLFEQLGPYTTNSENLLTYSLRDEQGSFNINNSDPTTWQNIEGLQKETIAGILDWLDKDNDTTPGGAENDYYEHLDTPYLAKNKPCIALKELLLIKDVTRQMYLGEDLNRNSVLDENERDGISRPPADNQDNKLDPGLVDVFTIYGSGKININTASATVLTALPEIDEQVVGTIFDYQSGPDGQLGTDDDRGIENTQGLSEVQGLTALEVELLQQYCCFESEYFRLFSYARVEDGFDCCLMATVRCSQNQPEVVSLERLQ